MCRFSQRDAETERAKRRTSIASAFAVVIFFIVVLVLFGRCGVMLLRIFELHIVCIVRAGIASNFRPSGERREEFMSVVIASCSRKRHGTDGFSGGLPERKLRHGRLQDQCNGRLRLLVRCLMVCDPQACAVKRIGAFVLRCTGTWLYCRCILERHTVAEYPLRKVRALPRQIHKDGILACEGKVGNVGDGYPACRRQGKVKGGRGFHPATVRISGHIHRKRNGVQPRGGFPLCGGIDVSVRRCDSVDKG